MSNKSASEIQVETMQMLFTAVLCVSRWEDNSNTVEQLKRALRPYYCFFHTNFPQDVKDLCINHALVPTNITGANPKDMERFTGGSIHSVECLIMYRLEQALREASESSYGTLRSRLFVTEKADKELGLVLMHTMSTGRQVPLHNAIVDCFPPTGDLTQGQQLVFKTALVAALPRLIKEVEEQLPEFVCPGCNRTHIHSEPKPVVEEVMTVGDVLREMESAIRSYGIEGAWGNVAREIYGPKNWRSLKLDAIAKQVIADSEGGKRNMALDIVWFGAQYHFEEAAKAKAVLTGNDLEMATQVDNLPPFYIEAPAEDEAA